MTKKLTQEQFKEIDNKVSANIENELNDAVNTLISKVPIEEQDPYVTDFMPAMAMQMSAVMNDNAKAVLKEVLIELDMLEVDE